MLKFIAIVLAGYVAVAVLMYLTQRSLLYLPQRYTDIDTTALSTRGIQPWPDHAGYRGYKVSDMSEPTDGAATVIVFHGNAGSAIDRLYYRDALAFSGSRLILAEYPGYGRRPGRPSEATLVSDARTIIEEIAETWPGEKLFVIGESLGTGVVAGAVSHARTAQHVDALILITPWDSLTAVAARHYWYLPVQWLLKDRYDSVEQLAGFTKTKLIIIAEEDSIVPAVHGQALFDAIPDSKKLVIIKDSGHNTWINDVDEQWWQAIWRDLHDEQNH